MSRRRRPKLCRPPPPPPPPPPPQDCYAVDACTPPSPPHWLEKDTYEPDKPTQTTNPKDIPANRDIIGEPPNEDQLLQELHDDYVKGLNDQFDQNGAQPGNGSGDNALTNDASNAANKPATPQASGPGSGGPPSGPESGPASGGSAGGGGNPPPPTPAAPDAPDPGDGGSIRIIRLDANGNVVSDSANQAQAKFIVGSDGTVTDVPEQYNQLSLQQYAQRLGNSPSAPGTVPDDVTEISDANRPVDVNPRAESPDVTPTGATSPMSSASSQMSTPKKILYVTLQVARILSGIFHGSGPDDTEFPPPPPPGIPGPP